MTDAQNEVKQIKALNSVDSLDSGSAVNLMTYSVYLQFYSGVPLIQSPKDVYSGINKSSVSYVRSRVRKNKIFAGTEPRFQDSFCCCFLIHQYRMMFY